MKPQVPTNGRGFFNDAHEAAFHLAVEKVTIDRVHYATRLMLRTEERLGFLEEKLIAGVRGEAVQYWRRKK